MNPLYVMTEQQRRDVNAALSDLNRAIDTIRRLELCGHDCTTHKQQVEQLIAQLEAIKTHFGTLGQGG